jgi:hypothetical protein
MGALGREQFGLELTAERLGPNGPHLGQGLTHGQVMFILSQPALADIWRTLRLFPRPG